MRTEEFLQARAAELCAFFLARFGRYWRAEVLRLGKLRVPPSWAQGKPVKSTIRLRQAEEFAERYGFKSAQSFERKFTPRLNALLESLESLATYSCLRNRLTLASLNFLQDQHRKSHFLKHSDVISDHFVEVLETGTRISTPCVGSPANGNVIQPGGITIKELLDQPLLDPGTHTPPDPAHPGGTRPPGQPLSGSSAENNLTREVKIVCERCSEPPPPCPECARRFKRAPHRKKPVVSARELVSFYRSPSPSRRARIYTAALKRLATECMTDHQLPTASRQHSLARCQRFIEGYFLRLELRQQLNDAREV